MQFTELNQNYRNSIMVWLVTLTFMVFVIIIIGGLTRLTDSGLSMVDWQPILGTIPPLNNDQWVNAFNDYKLTPEFLIVNKSRYYYFHSHSHSLFHH